MKGGDKMKIITLSGKAGCGKNYCANIINKLVDEKNNEFAYADSIKDIAKSIGWNGIKDEKGRKLLQDIGRVGREYNKDTWINFTIDKIKKI